MIPSDKIAALKALSTKVNTAYKSEVVKLSVTTIVPRIPTGSISADYVLGCSPTGYGGFAVGHGHCLVGWESSGKSSLCLKAVGNLQRMCVRCYRYAVDVKTQRAVGEDGKPILMEMGKDADGTAVVTPLYEIKGRCSCYTEKLWSPDEPEFTGSAKEKKEQEEAHAKYLAALKENSFEAATVVYADVENTLDMQWAERNGAMVYVYDQEYDTLAPVINFQHVVPITAEQAIDVVDEYIKSGVVDLVVVDSVAAMVPSEEKEASSEDWQRGLAARLVNKAFRRWVSSSAEQSAKLKGRRAVTTLYIQQWRNTMSQFSGNTMPGGNGQKFAYSTVTELYTSDKDIAKDEISVGSKNDEIASARSLRINLKNRKNKTAPPYKTASFKMSLVDDDPVRAGEVMEQDILLKHAISMGFVTKDGAKYKFRGKEYTSQSAVNAEIVLNESARSWLSREIRKRMYKASTGSAEVHGAADSDL